MPQPLRKDDYYSHANFARQPYVSGAVYDYPYRRTAQPYAPVLTPHGDSVHKRKPVPKRRVKQSLNPLRALVSLCFMAALVYYVIPYNFSAYFEPMILNRVLNRNLTLNAKEYSYPTLKYLANSDLNRNRLFVPIRHSKKQMVSLVPSSRMYGLETSLNNLKQEYPHLKPSIYVWDYTNSRSAEIDSYEIFPSASIIKLPILVELFRRSEALKAAGRDYTDFSSKLLFDEIHRTSGSGSLQYKKANTYYSIDYLAKIMIRESDNSATNMLLEEIGGMGGLNSAIRKWGLPSTQMSNWLPDLKGTNTISAFDMATLLYNIDNPKFLNERSRYAIKQYMSNVRNTSLLKAGIPQGADIIHKTGDIGTMLGDAGIVYAPNGKKYIAVILVERPFNDYSAREFIQKASSVIYDYVVQKPYTY